MKKRKLLAGVTMLSAVVMTLAACGKSNNAKTKTINNTDIASLTKTVPSKPAKKGGTVKTALITDTPFTGIFSPELTSTTTDYDLMQYGMEDLFDMDDHYVFNNKGPATININRKNKTISINIKKGVKWSDGKQVTAKDYEYSYEIVANPKSQSAHYSGNLTNIVGMEEYHAGKAKTISGIKMPDGANGRKIVLHFKQMKPGMKQSGNGYFRETAAPYHYLKNVPFNKLVSSDKIRKKPLFYGPYQVSDVVRGESVTWTPNKYYWRGMPKLSKIVSSVVSSKTATQALQSHKYDVIQVMSSKWNDVKKTKNFNFVKGTTPQYAYLGYKVGKWDAKKSKNVMDSKSKMNNKALRQAIAYGLNIEQTYGKMSQGAAFRVPTLIPAQFGDYSDKNIKGYTFNIKKGNKLLDRAGYKKKGTYRVQPNGKKLIIRLAAVGSANNSPIIQNFIQQWKKEGLRVKLTDNRLLDQNVFQQKLQSDSPDVDMFMSAWSLATEPSPASLYSEKSPMNYGRFVTKKNNQLLTEIDSEKAFNHSYRVDKFHEWQKYMNDAAYVVPMYNTYQVIAVNSKLTGYSTQPSKSMGNKQPNWYYVAYKK